MSVSFDKTEALETVAPAWVPYSVPRVNLLPPEIQDERNLKKMQLILGGATAAVVALLAGGFILVAAGANQAEQELALEQTRTQGLQAEQQQYAEVPRILAEVETAQSARATAMTTDVLWYEYLHNVAATYPEDVWLKDLTATVAAPVATTAVVADPLTTPGIGTVVFNGSAMVHADVASWLDVLAATPGFADPFYTSSAAVEVDGQTFVDFSSQVVVTADALSHRYDRKAS